MAVFVLILLYIQHERTFDQFHTHKDRIYRIQQDRFNRGERTLHSVTGCYAAGPAIKASFPEVVDYIALHKVEPIIAYKGEGFKEENTCFATDKFFKYFSFRLLKGVDTLVLKEPHTAVVSRSFGNRVFKDEDPIGKTLSFRGSYDFDVTGVFEDMPENSHM